MVEKQKNQRRGVLYLLRGNNQFEMIKLRRDATIVGRDRADVVIDDTEVSSSHFQIQMIDGYYHIFDMNSTNGTFVNRERIVKSKLQDGDMITFGKTTFRFALELEESVRKIKTIFKTQSSEKSTRQSVVDTLIEHELNQTQSSLVSLLVSYADGSTETIELNQRLIYIGRASSFGRFDQDVEISRKHLMIKINDQNEVFIEDQNSTNGSFLNAKRIKGMNIVHSNDVVKIGATSFRIAAKASWHFHHFLVQWSAYKFLIEGFKIHCGRDGIGRHTGLRSQRRKASEFKSLRPHHFPTLKYSFKWIYAIKWGIALSTSN